ncbi:MAG: hypothetical protein ACI8U4_002544, partial [Natronomonas sp.]
HVFAAEAGAAPGAPSFERRFAPFVMTRDASGVSRTKPPERAKSGRRRLTNSGC